MSAVTSERIERIPMSFEDYLALPEDAFRNRTVEYVDGIALVSPEAKSSHNRIARRLANLIEASCPGLFVVGPAGVWTGERRSRIPDVLATAEPYDDHWATTVPVLVAEVLSPSTRAEDTLRKTGEYAERGIGHYWIIDRDNTSFTALVNNGHGWDIVLDLDAGQPTGEVQVGDFGVVAVNLKTLLAL
ncbi:Uma2 family endonuclease [Nocardioides sp.]|uniref:Uma2 family endonuclease n=1 Tax=Nocardioides sp. TaxID=35761 RepID=UPI0039E3FB1E